MNLNFTKLSKTDAIVGIYILVAFLMFLIPLPVALLDVFMAFNIAIAFTILFVCMFTKEVLDLSYFPTILLFTTIFRIAMNVSSTRATCLPAHPATWSRPSDSLWEAGT